MTNNVIDAIYETRCEQIQLAWLNPQTRPFINDAYAYAVSERMFPIYHHLKDYDAFEDAYRIGKDFVKEVHTYISKLFFEDPINISEELTFRNLEEHFACGEGYRDELTAILRYFKLSKKLNDAFFDKLLSDAHTGANIILSPLDEDDVGIIL